MDSSTRDKIISEDDCRQVLDNYLNRKNGTLITYKVDGLSDKVEGMLGQYYIVTITYTTPECEKNIQRFFLKNLSECTGFTLQMTQDINAYAKEEFFYRILLPGMHDYGFDISFAPKNFLFRSPLIVLEDMGQYQYRTIGKTTPFSLEHCKAALRTLAKFHAGSIAFGMKESNQSNGDEYFLNRIDTKLLEDKLYSTEVNTGTEWFHSTMKGVLGIIDLQPEIINGISRSDFKKRLHDFIATDLVKPYRGDVNVVLHGDMWANNIMFKCDDDNIPVDCVLVDFQMLKYGVPAFDVMQMIGLNTRQAFRQQQESTVLDWYYKHLMMALKRNQILEPEKLLSMQTFRRTCDDVAISTKIHAIVARATTFVADDTLGPIMNDDAAIRKFMLEDIGVSIVNSYQRNQVYREMLDEDIIELRALLCRSR